MTVSVHPEQLVFDLDALTRLAERDLLVAAALVLTMFAPNRSAAGSRNRCGPRSRR